MEWIAMANRVRRTHEQIAAELRLKLQGVESKMKNEARTMQTRRAVILGSAIQSMAESGDNDAKRVVDKVLAGLKRKQDRVAFDLEPLPEQEPAAQPSVPALADRVSRAVAAWNAPGDKTPERRVEMVDAIIALEVATGKLFPGIKSEGRPGFGLGDRPGERV
jgi:hypothetical protein